MHIIIATNNGGEYLRQCLESLSSCKHKAKVVVVDNGSTCSKTLRVLADTKFDVVKNPTNGYDTGAYMYAMNMYWDKEDELFFFCHDDVIFRQGFYEVFMDRIQNCDVLAFSTFLGCWDSDVQKEICMKIIGAHEFEEKYGIFGPIFLAKKSILRKAKEEGLIWFKPSDKLEQQAMERGWGYIFDKVGAKIDALVKWPGKALNENNHDSVIVHRRQVKQ
jgi:glycosyltransferase involved in cell wall biosynthesis